MPANRRHTIGRRFTNYKHKEEDIMRSIRFGALFAICTIAAVFCFAADDMPGRKELKRVDLSGAPGMEVITSYNEYHKGDVVPKHTHHGIETGYVIQGTMIQLPGKEPTMV
jgi:hypothetical protein